MSVDPQESPAEVAGLLRLLWRRRGLILTVWAAALVATGVATVLMPRTYQAELALVVGRIGRKAERGITSVPVEDRDIVAATIQNPAFLAATLARAGLSQTESVRVTVRVKGDLLELVAQGPEPGLVVRGVTAAAEAIVASHRERFEAALKINGEFEGEVVQLIQKTERFAGELSKALADRRGDRDIAAQALFQVKLADAETQLLALRERLRDLQELRSAATSYPTRITVPPVTPTRPVSPVVWLNLLVGGIFGFVLAVAVAYLVEFLPLLGQAEAP